LPALAMMIRGARAAPLAVPRQAAPGSTIT
jgi:hypothetical protein